MVKNEITKSLINKDTEDLGGGPLMGKFNHYNHS